MTRRTPLPRLLYRHWWLLLDRPAADQADQLVAERPAGMGVPVWSA